MLVDSGHSGLHWSVAVSLENLLGDQEPVLPHALYAGLLALGLAFLPRLLFGLLVHGLTDGFGTMFWQELHTGRKRGNPFLTPINQ